MSPDNATQQPKLFLDQLYARPKPEILYHYTNLEGLFGIVESKELWASHVQYLNDKKEYIHFIERVSSTLQKTIKSLNKNNENGIDISILEEMQSIIEFRYHPVMAPVPHREKQGGIFICSFSEEHDSLPQWKFYGGANAGIAIGFYSEFLNDLAYWNGYKIVPCVYEEEEKDRLAQEFINGMYDVFKGYKKNYAPKESILFNDLFHVATLVKHRSFKHEKEWRVVLAIDRPLSSMMRRINDSLYVAGFDPKLLDFRIAKLGITPYYKIKLFGYKDGLNSDKWSDKIRSIIGGPSEDPNLTWLSLQRYCGSKLHPDIGVGMSEIPFRSQ